MNIAKHVKKDLFYRLGKKNKLGLLRCLDGELRLVVWRNRLLFQDELICITNITKRDLDGRYIKK